MIGRWMIHVFAPQVFVNFAKQQSGEDDDITARLRTASTHKKKISPLRRNKWKEERIKDPPPDPPNQGWTGMESRPWHFGPRSKVWAKHNRSH